MPCSNCQPRNSLQEPLLNTYFWGYYMGGACFFRAMMIACVPFIRIIRISVCHSFRLDWKVMFPKSPAGLVPERYDIDEVHL